MVSVCIGLRGLSQKNTLVLLNGRRLANYGFPAGGLSDTFVNLNALPLVAVERIEVLKDGASAGIAYTVSKHGLLGATKHAAFRYKNAGITANAVLPGSVGTNISTSIQAQMDMESFMVCQPVHALNKIEGKEIAVSAEEVARAVVFLAGEGSGAISGVALPVDCVWSTI